MNMDLAHIMEEMKRNRIRIRIEGEAVQGIGASRFGGSPDVPIDFEWPYYFGKSSLDDIEMNRPLSFLAQFNCEKLAKYDVEGLLPKTGMLSFFYEEATAEWGYDPKHKGCARVYYFENVKALVRAEFPEDLEEDFRNPEIGVTIEAQISYPCAQDIKYKLSDEEYDRMEEYEDDESCVHQFLGWPGIIQNNISTECELIQKGYYLGNTWADIPQEDVEMAKNISNDKWQLLFQLDEVEHGDFYLSFGDSGRLYFYITKEDLKNCRFDNVWLVYQCC